MRKPAALLFLSLALTITVLAQSQGDQPDLTIDGQLRSQVIENAIKNLNDFYVFPEIAKKMEEAIRARITRKEYDSITSAKELAAALTAHLQEISHDKHLRVVYRSDPAPAQIGTRQTPEDRERQIEFIRSLNYGFEKVERLNGNIGYLDLRGFIDPAVGGDTAASAMGFLANTDALIIDLRNNGGGTPAMAVLLASYLFDADPVHYGVGVKPDIEVPAPQALKVAYLDALNKALEKITEPRRKTQIKSAIEDTQRELDQLKKPN